MYDESPSFFRIDMTVDWPVVLFLDFDGVLHHYFPISKDEEENRFFKYVPEFEKAVRACERAVEIVISSTWRERLSLVEIQAHFSPDIASKIIGVTPVVKGGSEDGGREREVQEWLSVYRPDSQWVGIDDVPYLYSSNAAVVACLDQFGEREHNLLVEAVRDPLSFAQNNPHGRSKFKM